MTFRLKMRIVSILFSLIFLFSDNVHIGRGGCLQVELFQQTSPEYHVAVKFINEYVDFLNNSESEASLTQWISERSDVSANFKNQIEEMLDDAQANDPSYGLGFDPILDAQDYPKKFELKSTKSEYLVVRGTDWSSFKLTMLLKYEDGKWIVDGSGTINIPKYQIMKR